MINRQRETGTERDRDRETVRETGRQREKWEEMDKQSYTQMDEALGIG